MRLSPRSGESAHTHRPLYSAFVPIAQASGIESESESAEEATPIAQSVIIICDVRIRNAAHRIEKFIENLRLFRIAALRPNLIALATELRKLQDVFVFQSAVEHKFNLCNRCNRLSAPE